MSNSIKRAKKRYLKGTSDLYITLLKNAGPIPMGIYKVIECTTGGFVCECGRKIIFGFEEISNDYFSLFRQQKEVKCLTSVEEFLVRYWSLMDELSNKSLFWKLWTPGPKTFCLLDPSLEYHG